MGSTSKKSKLSSPEPATDDVIPQKVIDIVQKRLDNIKPSFSSEPLMEHNKSYYHRTRKIGEQVTVTDSTKKAAWDPEKAKKTGEPETRVVGKTSPTEYVYHADTNTWLKRDDFNTLLLAADSESDNSSEEDEWTCDTCGTVNSTEIEVCPTCFNKKGGYDDFEEVYWKCKNCGLTNKDPDAWECKMCLKKKD